MTDQDLSSEENRAISALIREELAKRRITRQRLADMAKLSLSTLEKAMAGQRPFTLATVVRLEEALSVPLRKVRNSLHHAAPGVAPDTLGSYGRPAVQWLEGRYLTLRASFSTPQAVYAFVTEIRWDEGRGILAYRESERVDADYTHSGEVSVPHQSGYIYLVTNKHGQYRMSILSRPTITGEMYGLLTTLHLGRGTQLTPVATPIVLCPIRAGATPAIGKVEPPSPDHARYAALLKRAVDEPFVMMIR